MITTLLTLGVLIGGLFRLIIGAATIDVLSVSGIIDPSGYIMPSLHLSFSNSFLKFRKNEFILSTLF